MDKKALLREATETGVITLNWEVRGGNAYFYAFSPKGTEVNIYDQRGGGYFWRFQDVPASTVDTGLTYGTALSLAGAIKRAEAALRYYEDESRAWGVNELMDYIGCTPRTEHLGEAANLAAQRAIAATILELLQMRATGGTRIYWTEATLRSIRSFAAVLRTAAGIARDSGDAPYRPYPPFEAVLGHCSDIAHDYAFGDIGGLTEYFPELPK